MEEEKGCQHYHCLTWIAFGGIGGYDSLVKRAPDDINRNFELGIVLVRVARF